MKSRSVTRILQNIARIGILAVVTYWAVMHQLQGVLVAPNAHVFCPYGGLETLYKLLASGAYIKKIFPATMVLLLGGVLLAVILHRAFCGWICPLGTLQTIFNRIARFFKMKKIQVPAAAEKYLSWIKYAILVVSLYFSWTIGDLVYGYYDPWAAYTHLAAGFEELYAEFLVGTIFLLLATIGSFWLPNNFCRYFCPMGAFLSIFSKFSPTKISRNAATCINCKRCDNVCPAQIEIATKPQVTSAQCLSCGDCVNACPVDKTLEYTMGGKFRMNWLVYGMATIVVFFGSVYISKALGYWKTNFETAAEVVKDDTGFKNPYLIRGSMTLESVSQEFGVPVAKFLETLTLPADTDPKHMLKNIAAANQIDVENFREIIVEHLQEHHPGLVIERPAGAESH